MTRWLVAVALLVGASGCAGELADGSPRVAREAPVERAPILVEDSTDPATRVSFASTASSYVIEAAACSLRLATSDGRSFDVRVGERRCATSAMPERAVPVTVRVDARGVVLEAPQSPDAPDEWLRSALTQVASALESELAEASARLRHAEPSTAPNHGVRSNFNRSGGTVFLIVVGVIGVIVGAIAYCASDHCTGPTM